MNKENWILSTTEQAEIFPPLVVEAPEIQLSFEPTLFSPEEYKKPQDFYRLPMVQQDLFDLDPANFQSRIDFFAKFSTPVANFLAKKIKKRIKSYGNEYANQWFSQQMAQLQIRARIVMAQYSDVLSLFKMPYQHLEHFDELDYQKEDWDEPKDETNKARAERIARKKAFGYQNIKPIAERLENSKRLLQEKNLRPLCYLRPEQLKQIADGLAHYFNEQIHFIADEGMHTDITPEAAERLFRHIYDELARDCEYFHIPTPFQKAKTLTIKQIDIALLKLSDPDFWLNKLKRMAKRMAEHLAIAIGMVHSGAGGYVSYECLKKYEKQRKANFEFIKSCIITNILNEEEQFELLDIWVKSGGNPALVRIELMTRMRGFEEYAEREQHEGVFITFTAPSKYHAMLHSGEMNPKWNGSAPNETQQYLCSVWARIRTALHKRDIKPYGFRVAEPHHDGTPHWHMLFYVKPEQMREMKRIIYRYALEEDGHEPGAKRRRCIFKHIDKTKGSATGYIAKYIAKNIDGYSMTGLFSDETGVEAALSALAAKAWASCWGIRQFQQIGGADVSTYRELRRLGSVVQDDDVTETGRAVSDLGEFACYLDFQGGVFVKRKDQKLRINYVECGENKYGETRKKVNGVKNNANGKVTVTRLKQWVIGRKPRDWEERMKAKLQQSTTEPSSTTHGELARPWTCVNNCTSTENAQFLEICRERIKIDLTARGKRFTKYDIDDILNGKRFKFYSNEECGIYIRLSRGQVIEEKIPKAQFY